MIDDPLGPRLIETGGERLFRFEGREPGKTKGEVLLIHGLAGHPGRRFTTARLIARQGFAVTLFDLAGHGGRQESWKESRNIYEGYATSDDPSLIQQAFPSGPSNFFDRQYARLRRLRVSRHQEQIRFMVDRVLPELGRQPSLPLFLLGFSMGGLLAADAALRMCREESESGDRLKGVILLSPALRPRGRPSRTLEGLFVDMVWAGRDRPLSILRLMVKLTLLLNLRLDIAWGAIHMSDQQAEVELYRRDPLVFKAMPSAYASSIENLMTVVERNAVLFPVDGLFFLPEHDGIASVQGALRFARRVETTRGSRSCRLVEFEGLDAHDLTHSSVRDKVHDTILEWLESRVS